MKKVACKICGSTDVLVEDDIITCKNCGNKYRTPTFSNSKRPNKVKIDNTDALQNLLNRAKIFYKENDIENTIKYCEKVLDISINNKEALFLNAICHLGKTHNEFKKHLLRVYSVQSREDFDNQIKTFIKSTIKAIEGFDNPLHVFSKVLELVNLNNAYKQITTKEVNEKDAIIECVNKNFQKRYLNLEQYVYAEKDGTFIGAAFLNNICEILSYFDKDEKLYKETQQHILNITLTYLKEKLHVYKECFYIGSYHRNYFHSDAITDSTTFDEQQFSKIHDAITSFVKKIIEVCSDTDSEERKEICKIIYDHYKAFMLITWKGNQGIGFYKISDSSTEKLKKEQEYFYKIINPYSLKSFDNGNFDIGDLVDITYLDNGKTNSLRAKVMSLSQTDGKITFEDENTTYEFDFSEIVRIKTVGLRTYKEMTNDELKQKVTKKQYSMRIALFVLLFFYFIPVSFFLYFGLVASLIYFLVALQFSAIKKELLKRMKQNVTIFQKWHIYGYTLIFLLYFSFFEIKLLLD